MKKFRDSALKSLKETFGNLFTDEEYARLLERPKQRNRRFGDLAFPCFELVQRDDNPAKIAQQAAKDLKLNTDLIEKAEAIGPYINFHFREDELINSTLHDVFRLNNDYGRSDKGQGKLAIVEYSSPNIGKRMHVGHIRSTIIGDSIARILNFAGYNTRKINYLGDIGLPIGKLIAAYQMWGSPKELKRKREEELQRLYKKFCEKEEEYGQETVDGIMAGPLDDEDCNAKENPWTKKAKKTLDKLEAEDPELNRIMQKIYQISMDTFNKIYDTLGVEFDEITGQSKFIDKGKKIVQEACEKGIAYKDKDGAIKAKLEDYNLPDKILLRSDGTAIYSTEDIGAAVSRFERFNFHKMIYVVGSEQNLYFQQIFKTLELLGYNWIRRCKHVSFGLIKLGKYKMSSRGGEAIPLKELLDKAISKAREIIDKKNPSLEDKDKVARQIGVGAIKYMILSVEYEKDIDFSWEKALDFEGNSAPYIQYTHARALSVIRKGYESTTFRTDNLKTPEEIELVREISEFPILVDRVSDTLSTWTITDYALRLSSSYNHLYKQTRILKSNQEKSRLALTNAFRIVIRNALDLLGMEAPYEM